jgi:cell division protein FtsB
MPAFAIPVVIVAAILLAIIMLFGPVRTYYAAWRDAGRLSAEYEALSQQNTELMEQLDRLQSIEGIEDEARRRGYAYPDEEVLVVDGLEEEKLADPAKVDAAVEAFEENQPWYVGFLDNLFGYKRAAQDR